LIFVTVAAQFQFRYLHACVNAGVPVLSHHAYCGNQPDLPTFVVSSTPWSSGFYELDAHQGSNVSLVPIQHPELLAVPVRKLKAPDEIKGVRAWRSTKEVCGTEYTVMVSKNENLEQTQTAILLCEFANHPQKLQEILWQLRHW